MGTLIGHYATFLEFASMELVVVGAAIWSLVSVERSLKRDRQADKDLVKSL